MSEIDLIPIAFIQTNVSILYPIGIRTTQPARKSYAPGAKKLSPNLRIETRLVDLLIPSRRRLVRKG
jgi:hypothetical protein